MTNFDVNGIDRELFSELTESPILPFLIHMSLHANRAMIRIFQPKLKGTRFGFEGRLEENQRPFSMCSSYV